MPYIVKRGGSRLASSSGHSHADPVFQRATLIMNNWEWPGDEARSRSPDYIQSITNVNSKINTM